MKRDPEPDSDEMHENITVIAALKIYQKTGKLVLRKRVVIGDRVYDPAVYTLTHMGPPKHG